MLMPWFVLSFHHFADFFLYKCCNNNLKPFPDGCVSLYFLFSCRVPFSPRPPQIEARVSRYLRPVWAKPDSVQGAPRHSREVISGSRAGDSHLSCARLSPIGGSGGFCAVTSCRRFNYNSPNSRSLFWPTPTDGDANPFITHLGEVAACLFCEYYRSKLEITTFAVVLCLNK